MNLRFKWVGRWSGEERQLRLFRVMWESFGRGPDPVARYSHKLSGGDPIYTVTEAGRNALREPLKPV